MDGEQKMSNWPEGAKEYVVLHPDHHIAVGQSKYSKHKLMAGRLRGKRIFISYNASLQCFVAWNVAPNIQDARGADDVWLKLSARCMRIYATEPKQISFYEPMFASGQLHCYQKICVFPAREFVEFYENYANYMQPNREDTYYQTPAAEF